MRQNQYHFDNFPQWCEFLITSKDLGIEDVKVLLLVECVKVFFVLRLCLCAKFRKLCLNIISFSRCYSAQVMQHLQQICHSGLTCCPIV